MYNMIPKPRISESAIALINKARKTSLNTFEAKELHFEFLRIMRALKNELPMIGTERDRLSWQIDFPQLMAIDNRFQYHIKLYCDQSEILNISFDFRMEGSSYVQFELIKGETASDISERLRDFTKTAAYKRYFAHYSDDSINKSVFRTSIPRRQLSSGYLFDYMLHLINQMSVPVELVVQREIHKAA